MVDNVVLSLKRFDSSNFLLFRRTILAVIIVTMTTLFVTIHPGMVSTVVVTRAIFYFFVV